MTEEQIEHARNSFVKAIKDYNKNAIYRLSLQKTKDGYANYDTNVRWNMFLAGYKASLELLLNQEPVGFIDANGDPILSFDGLRGGYLYRDPLRFIAE